VLAISLIAGVGWAQEEPTEEAAAEEVAQEGEQAQDQQEVFIEEIVVTARKTSESINDIPLTMRAFTADDLKAQGVESVDGVAELTPGLVISNYQGFRDEAGLKFRGMDVGTQDRTAQGSSAFIDGVYLPGSSQWLNMENLERSEVVKGPQSAFYGRNVFGGAINLITKKPTPDFAGDASLTYGSNERIHVNAGVGGPISDKFWYRVFGRYYDYGGAFDNPVPDSETLGSEGTKSISGALSFTPGPSSEFTLRLLYTENDDGPASIVFFPSSILNCGPFETDGVSGDKPYYCGTLSPDLANDVGYDTTVEDVPGATWPKDDFGLERSFYLASFDFDLVLGSGNTTLSSLTSYLEDDVINMGDFTGTKNLLWWYDNTDTLFSQELRVNGSTNHFDWLVGGYYLDAEYVDNGNNFGCAGGDTLVFGYLPLCNFFGWPDIRGYFAPNAGPPVKINNQALFGSLTWRASDSVSLSAEARYASEELDEGNVVNIVDGSTVNLNDTFDSFSPRVILNWSPTPDAMLYASVAQGNKSGNFNSDFAREVGTDCQAEFTAEHGIGLSVPEEKMLNYEAGWKQTFSGGRHTFNAAGYYMDWTDQQFRSFVNLVDTNCDGVVDENDEFQIDGLISAGKSEIIGAEFYYSGWFSRFFNLTASYNYNQTEYLEFEDTEYGRTFGTRDASGQEMPRSPNDAATLGLLFRLPVFGSWEFFANSTTVYTGGSWTWAHNLATTGSSTRTAIRTGFENDRWVFTAWVENVTDDDTIMWNRRFTDFGGFPFQNGFWSGLARPREYGATIRLRF
jgi:outer membrane receptor protein involved in Fe transport